MTNNNRYLVASQTPRVDINSLTYPGQDSLRRLYRFGYENYFESMHELKDDDPFLESKIEANKRVMQALAMKLIHDKWTKEENKPEPGQFIRTILGMETPKIIYETASNEVGMSTDVYAETLSTQIVKEGSEIVFGSWGDGHTSPVHGHAPGYLHEEIIFGKMKVNKYRMIAADSDVVRPAGTTIETRGTFASLYTKNNPEHKFKRQTLIHNFTAIGHSGSLHFLPEHTRDGRDNQFKVEYFDDVYSLAGKTTRVAPYDGMYSQKGDVFLVRSSNVPEYGDHYIIITGHPVMKLHGLRPQDVAFDAPNNKLLKEYGPKEQLVLLKLDKEATKAFQEFHGITVEKNEVIFNN